MSFVLKKVTTFVWPVKIKIPSAGKYEEHVLNLTFKKLKNSEMKALFEKFKADNSYSEFCKQVIVGWSEFNHEEGMELEFNEENLNLLLDEQSFGEQIFNQYFDAIAGVVEKN